MSSTSVRSLKTVVFVGSAKNVSPPWGGDARLGDRVISWVKTTLSARRGKLGADGENGGATVVTHDFTVVDPLDVFGEGGALHGFTAADLRAPTFMVPERDLPTKTVELRETIRAADCYLIVSPEYNHVVPPALASVMGHFGGSLFKCKPSGIVTYSPSPWGGMRAAVSILAMCHELGCLPVSKLCGIPTVADILEADGTPKDPANRMLKQLPDLLTQLEWMAVAMKNQRDATGTF